MVQSIAHPSPDYGPVRVVGLDADTLWHSEDRFREIQSRFHGLLARHVDVDDADLEERTLAVERRNLALFGYGAKAFTLSLIETAIEVTDGAIPTGDIGTIIAFGKELLERPVELLPGVAETIDALQQLDLRLLVITKGDLLHQESKLAASGLADRFDGVEIVSEKDPATYTRILGDRSIDPEHFCMVGNSVRSDVLPVVEVGGRAVHVPYQHVWGHEVVDAGTDHHNGSFATIETITALPGLFTTR